MKTLSLNEEQCWQAVLTRADAEDFVYAVRSTGIYCRPTCPARRPGRDQVRFFANADDAENAGFRACRRCRPREAAANAEEVTRVCRYIESHRDETLRLESLSALAGLSPQHFQRTFRKRVGVTPRQYADACRLGDFKAKMKNGEAVTSALIDAGYGSTSRLYERAPEQLGMTPGVYRRGGQGAS
ncbi:MAG: helix-turn-helix domain-containing protein, partial [Armatimonadota bacterium]|nr:helix-turn-helix domain-containing protein [Armatimonadota bacterium]